MESRTPGIARAGLRGGLVLILFWLIAFVLVQFGERVIGGWAASVVGLTLACVLGVALALRVQARFAAFAIAGLLAFSAAELVLRSIYGMQSVQGSGAHFAVMLSGVLGVFLGWYLSRGMKAGHVASPSGSSHSQDEEAAAGAPGMARGLV